MQIKGITMKKISALLLMTCLAVSVHISAGGAGGADKNSGKQQQKNTKAGSVVRFRVNLKKGFSCRVAYNAEVDIARAGQSDGAGRWKSNAELLLECTDVSEDGTMAVSQSPLKVRVEGTKINGKYEVDFNSPEKNLRIPELIRGHLYGLLKIRSARFDNSGRVVAARESPARDDFDFMAMGKISYENNPEWILPDNPENTETVNSIVRSLIGLFPNIEGNELTVGQTLTINRRPEPDNGEIVQYWTLKSVKNGLAQLEFKQDIKGEHKIPNEFVDEVEDIKISAKESMEADIDSGLVYKCQGNMENADRIMTLTTVSPARVQTSSYTSRTRYSFEIIKK
jgi:hypothetical protein